MDIYDYPPFADGRTPRLLISSGTVPGKYGLGYARIAVALTQPDHPAPKIARPSRGTEIVYLSRPVYQPASPWYSPRWEHTAFAAVHRRAEQVIDTYRDAIDATAQAEEAIRRERLAWEAHRAGQLPENLFTVGIDADAARGAALAAIAKLTPIDPEEASALLARLADQDQTIAAILEEDKRRNAHVKGGSQ